MADTSTTSIDQIIAGGAGASSRADFSGIGQLADAYYKSRDEAYKNRVRDAFQGGVPMKDGQLDTGAIIKNLIQTGGLEQAIPAANLDLQRQQLQAGQEASAKMGQAESGGTPQPTIVSPVSSNRNASAPAGPPLNKGGAQSAGNGAPATQQQGGTTIMQVLAAQGIPNDQLGAAGSAIARQLGVDDPNAPVDINDPRVRNVLVPAIQQLKRGGIGQPQPQQAPPQGVPQQAPGPQGAPVQAAPPQGAPVAPMAQPNPQQNQGTFGAPSAIATRGAIPTGTDPEIQKQIATYTAIAANPAYPKSVQEAAKSRLEALQRTTEPTGPMKEYDLARRQGYNGSLQDFMAENEAKKSAATEEAKSYVVKYDNIDEAGTKAIQEIPKLQTALKLMDSKDFYSGIGNNYNLALKRVAVALGGDPDKAAPQEIVGKVIADSVLNGLGSLKGLGPIRVAEMNLARTAAMSPDNTPETNRFLANVAIRIQQRAVQVSDLAQKYKEDNGRLDVGFDRQVRAIDKQSPLISQDEVQRFQSIIDGKAKAPSSQASASNPPMPNAKQAPDGNWYVPDPNRQGKYLKVVQ